MLGFNFETVRNSGVGTSPGIMMRVKSAVAGTRAVRQLHKLDDRLLADIGLSRGDISARVWGKSA